MGRVYAYLSVYTVARPTLNGDNCNFFIASLSLRSSISSSDEQFLISSHSLVSFVVLDLFARNSSQEFYIACTNLDLFVVALSRISWSLYQKFFARSHHRFCRLNLFAVRVEIPQEFQILQFTGKLQFWYFGNRCVARSLRSYKLEIWYAHTTNG